MAAVIWLFPISSGITATRGKSFFADPVEDIWTLIELINHSENRLLMAQNHNNAEPATHFETANKVNMRSKILPHLPLYILTLYCTVFYSVKWKRILRYPVVAVWEKCTLTNCTPSHGLRLRICLRIALQLRFVNSRDHRPIMFISLSHSYTHRYHLMNMDYRNKSVLNAIHIVSNGILSRTCVRM